MIEMNWVTPKYQGIVDKAQTGRSPKSAIHAHCLMCVGCITKEIRNCTDKECPFYPYRPYQEKPYKAHKGKKQLVTQSDLGPKWPPGYVYIFKRNNATNIYKIGQTSYHPLRRLHEIEKAKGIKLELATFIKSPMYLKIEQEMHNLFAEQRIKGEWFKLNGLDFKTELKRVAKQETILGLLGLAELI